MPRSRAWYQTERKKHEIGKVQPSGPSTSSFAGPVVQGFGFGIGSSIAHNVVGSVAKSLTSTDQPSVNKAKPNCEEYRRAFDACLLDTSCSNEMARNMWIDLKQCVNETL